MLFSVVDQGENKTKHNMPTWPQNAENPISMDINFERLSKGEISPVPLQGTAFKPPSLKSCILPRFRMYCMFSCNFGT